MGGCYLLLSILKDCGGGDVGGKLIHKEKHATSSFERVALRLMLSSTRLPYTEVEGCHS